MVTDGRRARRATRRLGCGGRQYHTYALQPSAMAPSTTDTTGNQGSGERHEKDQVYGVGGGAEADR